MKYPKELMRAVKNKKATFVTGAGFSAALAPDLPAKSWSDFVRAAIRYAQTADPDDTALEGISNKLEDGRASVPGDELVGYAAIAKSALLGHGKQFYYDFLCSQFEGIKPVNIELAAAVASFGCGIATTNYDTLFEDSVSIDASPTLLDKDRDEALKVLRNEKLGVVHLHGKWSDSDSVIFSQNDYASHVGNRAIMDTELGLFTLTTFIFVGQGEGVYDPNFTALKTLWENNNEVSEHRHYLLCRDSELDDHKRKLAGTTISPLSYGTSYKDLEPFLSNLKKEIEFTEKERQFAALRENLVSDLEFEIRDSSLADDSKTQAASVFELIIDPLFLPHTHEEYVANKQRAQREKVPESEQIKPIKAHEILNNNTIWIIAGEEQSGLTTAIKWLLLKSSDKTNSLLPVFVDHASSSRKNRLDKMIKNYISKGGMRLQKKDDIPPFVLGIDQFIVRSDLNFSNFIDDMIKASPQEIYLGCSVGQEHEIMRKLLSYGQSPSIAYLGKPGPDQIQALAKVIAPNSEKNIADAVRSLIRKEHLPRNPMTVSLMLRVLSESSLGGKRIKSQSDLIARFLELMLTQSDESVDARDTLDLDNIELVLIELAKTLINNQSSQISTSKITEFLQEIFDRKEWSEDSIAWVQKLVDLRLLKRAGEKYEFRQSSYLFYYAARAAVRNSNFNRLLHKNPLMYARILKLIAAIKHDDDELVRITSDMLDEWVPYEVSSPIYLAVTKTHSPEIEDIEDAPSEEVPHDSINNEEKDDTDYYDFSSDNDVTPFPLQDLENISKSVRIHWAVDLASVVLRESNEIDDRGLKDKALNKILTAWGVYLDQLDQDEVSRSSNRESIAEAARLHGIPDAEVDAIFARFNPLYCCFLVWGGIAGSLRSKKLRQSLNRVHKEAVVSTSLPLKLGVALFELSMIEPGWARRVAEVSEGLRGKWIYPNFVSDVVAANYVYGELTDPDKKESLKMVENKILDLYTFDSEAQKNQTMQSFKNNLDKMRLNKRQLFGAQMGILGVER